MHNADDNDAQERQLRKFLEGAVPLLQAPPNRMRHIHTKPDWRFFTEPQQQAQAGDNRPVLKGPAVQS
ncbi:hypothetical protein [Streptomyces cavernae]|uniref:hypothetical protein n=1 Tax=Streptomyces cavernae TaxID=2259034 RepID=UPI0012D8837A|nr:hypothetical protein [Streptomyces cavernae]